MNGQPINIFPMTKIQLRIATAADEPFLFALFAHDKSLEFAPLGWSSEQLKPLVEMQFRARQQSWAQAYPSAVDSILCLEGGEPIGRHLVDRQPDCYRIVDLAVITEYRNRGIGTWALHLAQESSRSESVALRLRVVRTNIALRLYERLGFMKIAEDELAFEMEWASPTRRHLEMPRQDRRQCAEASATDREQICDRIYAFLREIGLSVQFAPLPSAGFLPGIQMIGGGLRIDLSALLYPGDLLHEAGHLAVMPPERRNAEAPCSNDPAEEMAAIAWSYAAATHLGLPAGVVFHPHGYKGQSSSLLHQFESGNFIGLPMLWWLGMTTRPEGETPSIFPGMLHWLRESLG